VLGVPWSTYSLAHFFLQNPQDPSRANEESLHNSHWTPDKLVNNAFVFNLLLKP
jgi:hypothetical protein